MNCFTKNKVRNLSYIRRNMELQIRKNKIRMLLIVLNLAIYSSLLFFISQRSMKIFFIILIIAFTVILLRSIYQIYMEISSSSYISIENNYVKIHNLNELKSFHLSDLKEVVFSYDPFSKSHFRLKDGSSHHFYFTFIRKVDEHKLDELKSKVI